MIAQLQGEYLTFAQASKLLPGSPTTTTIWRWSQPRGIRGQRLGTVRIGGQHFIPKSELERFITALQTTGGNQ
jgi:hypothetical protein